MPEDNPNESALEPVLGAPPDQVIHEYMTPSVGQSVTILDPDVQGVIDEFKKERLELDALEDEDSVSNLPAKVEADLSSLTQQLGGPEVVQALAHVLNNPNSDLSQILPASAVENLVWTALDNPVTQSNVLADPQVRAAISNELFFGHAIEDVQKLLSQYERSDGVSQQQLEANYVAAETRVQNFQRSFFTKDIDETVDSFGVDESDHEVITDALLLARAKFLDANHVEFLNVQSLHERGLASQAAVSEARLQNKWVASVLKELGKLNGKTKQTKTMKPKDQEQKDKPVIDAGLGNNGDWLHHFTNDFSAERKRRGLLTEQERKAAQGK